MVELDAGARGSGTCLSDVERNMNDYIDSVFNTDGILALHTPDTEDEL